MATPPPYQATVQSPPPPSLAGVYVLLLIIAFLLSVVAFHFLPTATPRWEYMIKDVPDSGFTDQMNDLGNQGWEAVSARRASDGADSATFSYEIIFRRSKH
jgi:hypothetical protein